MFAGKFMIAPLVAGLNPSTLIFHINFMVTLAHTQQLLVLEDVNETSSPGPGCLLSFVDGSLSCPPSRIISLSLVVHGPNLAFMS